MTCSCRRTKRADTIDREDGIDMDELTGQVALVTGSSRGIGAAIARVFAARGAAVALHGRDAAALTAVRQEIEHSGARTMAVTADVTRFEDIERMREEIEQTLGPVTVLVANAGGNSTPPKPFEDIAEEEWRASVDANLTATFLTLKAFLPGMKARRRGTIITMSSAAARRAHPKSPVPYSAAKAGIQILTQHLATQVGAFGIRVNCLAPESILTARNEQQIPRDIQERMSKDHPLGRLGTPEDVANAALYLASAQSAWVTGIILDIAGGAVMP
jgi:3-oxoacyl-[acyl-carrier protein] reductase